MMGDVVQQLRLQIVARWVRYRDADGLPLLHAVLTLFVPVESFVSVFEEFISRFSVKSGYTTFLSLAPVGMRVVVCPYPIDSFSTDQTRKYLTFLFETRSSSRRQRRRQSALCRSIPGSPATSVVPAGSLSATASTSSWDEISGSCLDIVFILWGCD
ncbi:MAG: hypothetical protein J07HQX50_02114 [Haloquadratum sp. J07HQX50]|nr:MAG: hypothetical protein J07HQX50_02114 [Haloquadratum sp. J07HQX50]